MRVAFIRVGAATRYDPGNDIKTFPYWCLGACLFAVMATGLSVSFFGQSQVFLWLPIAAIGSIPLTKATAPASDYLPNVAAATGWPSFSIKS